MHSPVPLRHARLLNFVDALLRIYVERFDLGMVFREVVAVRLSSRNVFLPDLAFYRKDRLGPARDNYIHGAPDLAVEVLSPRTAHRDMGVKFVEYEQHGVEEYWVLDPETLAHRFYARRGEVLTEFAAGEPVIRSTVLPGLPCAGRGSPPISRRRWKIAWRRARLRRFPDLADRQTPADRTSAGALQGLALKPYGNGHREHRAPSEAQDDRVRRGPRNQRDPCTRKHRHVRACQGRGAHPDGAGSSRSPERGVGRFRGRHHQRRPVSRGRGVLEPPLRTAGRQVESRNAQAPAGTFGNIEAAV